MRMLHAQKPNVLVIRTNPSFWDILCARTLWATALAGAAPHATADLTDALVTLCRVRRYVCCLVAPTTARAESPKVLRHVPPKERLLVATQRHQDFLACRRSGLLSGHGSRLVHAAATSPRRGTSHRRRSLTRSSHYACHGTGRMAVCVCTVAAVVVVCSSDVESQLLL